MNLALVFRQYKIEEIKEEVLMPDFLKMVRHIDKLQTNKNGPKRKRHLHSSNK